MKAPRKPSGRRALPFYWWRRFRSHKSLPYSKGLIDKIRNGDFEYPVLFEQADWELQWMEQAPPCYITHTSTLNCERHNFDY